MAKYAQKLAVVLSTLLAVLLLSCCFVSLFHPIVVRMGDRAGGNLDRGVIYAITIGRVAPDAGPQPRTWAVPGFRCTLSPVSTAGGPAVFHFWAGTDRQLSIAPPDTPSRTRLGLYYVTVNGWLVTALAAVYPVVAFVRGPWRRRRRRKRGWCAQCGYDLTGNVSGVCPECGGAR